MKIITVTILACCLIFSGCAAQTAPLTAEVEQTNVTGLQTVDQSKFDSVEILPNFERSAPTKVYVQLLDLNNVEIREGYSSRYSRTQDWTLEESDKYKLQDIFADAVAYYFNEENGYYLAPTAQEADITIAPRLTKIRPYAPKDDIHSRQMNTTYYTEGTGELSIEIDVNQDETLVMRVEDRREAGQMWAQNNRITNLHNVRVLFKTWARNLERMF